MTDPIDVDSLPPTGSASRCVTRRLPQPCTKDVAQFRRGDPVTVPTTDIADWNPCATCRCAGTCFARCCPNHDEPCEPGRLCCPACPEQWHPQHPETIDCVRAEIPLPPLPGRPAPATAHASTVPTDVQHLADVLTDAYMRGIRNGPYTLARTILDAGYRRPTGEPRAAVLTWDWRQQPDLDQLGRVIHDLSGGAVHLRAVNTGSDEYAVVVANTDLDEATTQATYQRWCDDGVDVAEVRRD